MILVDTSIWVALLRRTIHSDASPREFATCGPILQEVFQGLSDSDLLPSFQDSLLALPRLEDPLSAGVFLEAARIYRHGRRSGYTIRSASDCLIAAIALRHDIPVWHQDRDFDHIARYTALRSIRTPRPH